MDKAQGTQKLLSLWRMEEKDTIAVGDYFNDLPVICAFHSYAMVNAPQLAQHAADYVVPDVIIMINNELNR